HDAARLLFVRQAADAVIGAAELEGARHLKRLGLHQHPPADGLVQGRMLEQRRANGGGGDLAGGVDDACEGGRRHGFPLTERRSIFITARMHANMILAIDQGTTSTRAIAFEVSSEGGFLAVAVSLNELAKHFPLSCWVEHDAAEIWRATMQPCREVVRKAGGVGRFAAIGIT